MKNSFLLEHLMPDASPEEREEAGRALQAYLRVVMRIYEYICADPKRYEDFKTLTAELARRTIQKDRSNLNSNITEPEA